MSRAGTQTIVFAGEVTPPPEVADAFAISASERVVLRRRIILLDDVPVEVAESYYPLYIAQGTRLAELRKVPGGAVSLLAELGHATKSTVEDVSARLPTSDECELLGTAADEPVLILFRVVFADERRPVEVSIMTMIAKGRHLRYQL